MEIKEIKFIMSKKAVTLGGLEIKKLFRCLECNSIRTILKSSWREIGNFNVFSVLFKSILRKFIGKVSITKKMQYKLLPYLNKYSEKDIRFVSVVFSNGKSAIFDTSDIPQVDILQDIKDIMYKNQYFAFEKNIKDKIVLDCGANKGVFSIYSVLLGAKKVYSFEPVSRSNINLLKTIRLNKMEDKIILFRKALGDENRSEKISYRYTGDGGGQINPKFVKENGWISESVDVCRFDDLNLGKIEFIKIDTEGYEAKVLIGAEKTIKKFKPILSLSAYHKPSDKKELPELIKNIREDYSVRLNKFSEEDLYCY
ncbi:MAG: FkbM family methyltransferase [Candidatus Pacearchaeota archaeon]